MRIVYFSLTGNVRRFVQRLDRFPALEITAANPFIEMEEPFVFIAPAYEKEVTDIAWDFMETGQNAKRCQGVIGSGNLNFDALYIYTAKDLAHDFAVPLLDSFEYFGTTLDQKRIEEKLYAIAQGKPN